ncbi:phospholipase A1 2-like [Macrosteles quadrilineatus]|uniref:phospholipase A1 2-like n=1 Tax=Macrosteles quadrilineatus TaxID=74068 RepID=UPI0023E2ECE0|nr:phospholipase A1 2-like [Macrosteles quadrilineatus]
MKSLFITALLIHCLQLCLVEAIYYEDKIKLRLYREGYSVFETARISEGETLFQESKGFNQTLPLVLIIHGMDHGADCYAVNGIIRAFNKRKLTNKYNIFAVDMPELFENSFRNQFYFGILANVQPAGDAIGEMFSRAVQQQLVKPENINIIGYSIGAQVAGYAARVVKETVGEINFIAGLDPAGPGFHAKWKGHPALMHVSASDARIAHFYHTNSISCGTRNRVGTADFVYNKGTIQPGCTKDKGLDCSHTRVPKLYIESVYRPHKFVARKCPNWKEFSRCACNKHETVAITFPPNESAKGIYYLRTKAQSPFALKKKGARCPKIVQKHKKKLPKKHKVTVASEIKPSKDYILTKYNKKKSFITNLIEGIQKIVDAEMGEETSEVVVDESEEPKEKKEDSKYLETKQIQKIADTEMAEEPSEVVEVDGNGKPDGLNVQTKEDSKYPETKQIQKIADSETGKEPSEVVEVDGNEKPDGLNVQKKEDSKYAETKQIQKIADSETGKEPSEVVEVDDNEKPDGLNVQKQEDSKYPETKQIL